MQTVVKFFNGMLLNIIVYFSPGVAEVLLNAIGFGDSLEDAVSAKRLSPDRMSNTVHYEGRSGSKVF